MKGTTALCAKIDTIYETDGKAATLKLVKKLAEVIAPQKMADGRDKRERLDDVVQLCMMAVSRSKFENTGEAHFSTWVCDIIRYTVYEENRQLKRRVELKYMGDVFSVDDEGGQRTLREVIEEETELDGTVPGEVSEHSTIPVVIGCYPSVEAYEVMSLLADGMTQKAVAEKRGVKYATLRKKVSRWNEEMERDAARRIVREADGEYPDELDSSNEDPVVPLVRIHGKWIGPDQWDDVRER